MEQQMLVFDEMDKMIYRGTLADCYDRFPTLACHPIGQPTSRGLRIVEGMETKHKIEWRIGGEWQEFAVVTCTRVNAMLIVWAQMSVTKPDDTLANFHNWRIVEID